MMHKFLVVLLPMTPSNCVAANTSITGLFTIAKFQIQSFKVDTNETQYQGSIKSIYKILLTNYLYQYKHWFQLARG
jgi:hypothetical protein